MVAPPVKSSPQNITPVPVSPSSPPVISLRTTRPAVPVKPSDQKKFVGNVPGARNGGRTRGLARLFTRDGLPVLASIVVGIIFGYFINGALGLILATVAGFAVLYRFGHLPFRLSPWPVLIVDVTPIVAKLMFYMVFLLPVANYLALPSGHTPNTLTKYGW